MMMSKRGMLHFLICFATSRFLSLHHQNHVKYLNMRKQMVVRTSLRFELMIVGYPDNTAYTALNA